jgi:hypothetical protein
MSKVSPKHLPLQHVDLSPVLVKLDFVHQLVDQVNASAMIGINIFALARIGNLAGIKTWAGIAHYNQDPMLVVAGYVAFDNL